MKKYDLQVHSAFSDGSDLPQEIIDKAKLEGVSGLAITDHDTLDAYTPELFEYAKQMSIELLVGIELSTTFRGHSIDVLGFGMRLDGASILDIIARHQESRKKKNRDILRKLADHGMTISEKDLSRIFYKGNLGRPHIALAMVQKGYVSSIKEAFEKWIGDNKPCYDGGDYFSIEETIESIQKSGGVAILAHPHLIRDKEIFHAVIANYPLDGIEVYYGRQTLKQCEPFVKIAQKKNFLITGGSDYHGSMRPGIVIGNSWIGESEWEKLHDGLQRRVGF